MSYREKIQRTKQLLEESDRLARQALAIAERLQERLNKEGDL